MVVYKIRTESASRCRRNSEASGVHSIYLVKIFQLTQRLARQCYWLHGKGPAEFWVPAVLIHQQNLQLMSLLTTVSQRWFQTSLTLILWCIVCDTLLIQVMSVYSRCRRTRHELLEMY